MADLAELGLRIHSEEVDTADKRLDAFSASANAADAAVDKLADAARGLGTSLLPVLSSIDATVKEMLELQRAQQGIAAASTQQVVATQAVAAEATQAAAAIRFYGASFQTTQATMGGAAASARDWGDAVAQADSHVVAFRQHMEQLSATMPQMDAHVVAWRKHLANAGDTLPPLRAGFRLTAAEGLNFSRQVADIGVTAAMGMNPFMIALQQGPQLFDIMQGAAIRSGITIRAAMAATGAAIWKALAPLLPIIAAIAAAAVVLGAAFALGSRAASKEIGDLTVGMGLTQDQLKRLKDEGISTTTTMGDVFRGIGTTIKESFFDLFGEEITALGEKWDKFLDNAWRFAVAASKNIGGSLMGAAYAVGATWRLVPAALGNAAYAAANAVLGGVERMVNLGVSLINGLIDKANAAADAIPGLDAFIPRLTPVEIARVSDPFSGAMETLGREGGEAFSRGFDAYGRVVDRTISRLVSNIRASGQARLRAAAGEAGATGGGGANRPDRLSTQRLTGFDVPDVRPLDLQLPELIDPLKLISDELRLIDGLARETAQGLASAFGDSGAALGDLLTIMTGYESRLADINLAEKEHRLTAIQAERERAAAQIGQYGDMAAAARGFFKDGSDGYKALLAIEQVYRAVQLAGALQGMAIGGQETAMSVANSLAKGAASAAAGAAKMFETLGPWAFPAVAAMLGVLAGLGLGGRGGSSRGGQAANDNSADASTAAVRGYSVRDQQGQTATAAAMAQAVTVVVTTDDDRFNAYVDGRTQPVTAAAHQSAISTARSTVPVDQSRRAARTLKTGRRA